MNDSFLARFTPSLMSHAALEHIFVQREELARSIVERIRDSVLTPAKHHVLLVGPRGMGKTHLVALVYHRVKAMDDLTDRMRVAWLNEEEWGITSYLDLLLRILRALQEEYGDAELTDQVENLYDLSAADAEHVAEDVLTAYLDDRVLLVLAENLDDIFGGLKEQGQQQLRAFLQNHGHTAILATAQSLFNGVALRESPFYGFFNIQHLKELTLDEAVCLLKKVAELEEDQPLVEFLQTPKGRARVRAVHHLAGGNPRVYLIFSQFLSRDALDDLVTPFMQMLDDLTPYYQARMAWLSPQQRKIVEFLIEHRGAAIVKRIAQRCFMSHQTASGQLKSLRDFGYVVSEQHGRESYYELREPLMRLAVEVKKHRGKPIRLLLDFLRVWYTRDELEERLTLLKPEAVLEREYIQHVLEIMGNEAEDPVIGACVVDYERYMDNGEYSRALLAAEELTELWRKDLGLVSQGAALLGMERYDEAHASLEKAGKHLSKDTSYAEELNVIINQGKEWIVLMRKMETLTLLAEKRRRMLKDIEIEFKKSNPHKKILIERGSFLIYSSVPYGDEGIRKIVDLYDQYQASVLLRLGLINSIRILAELPEAYVKALSNILGEREEFQLPLRLLDIAIRYRETQDQRVLLELPVEERRILEQALGLEEKAEAEQ